ncbi:MAG: 2-oxo-4-hydroxy-4-carboxy-5-ureidoimidazoline decarboxylase [Chloroflexi bacterium]|nr:2-oxo-4-hydroxy-4-carboxy-5-ureidoimidazoline decarboxylase [Chloroflexota bacterium]
MRSLAMLNEASADEFVAELSPLFEGAPGLVARLAAERPFETADDLWAAARALARSMPEEDQIELLNAHPPIGGDPTTMSDASRSEQGYDGDGNGGEDGEAWVNDELAALNEAYEGRFGFRFVVFVGGRPRSAILPLLERAVAADRDEELRRGLDDAILIAADRAGRLGGAEPMPEALREAIALEVSRYMVGETDAEGLVRAARHLVAQGLESPALLSLSLADPEAARVAAPISRLLEELGLSGWDHGQAGQLLGLHAAASILGEVSRPIDGARRIVAATGHGRLRELVARWEASSDERPALDVLITREARDLFEGRA